LKNFLRAKFLWTTFWREIFILFILNLHYCVNNYLINSLLEWRTTTLQLFRCFTLRERLWNLRLRIYPAFEFLACRLFVRASLQQDPHVLRLYQHRSGRLNNVDKIMTPSRHAFYKVKSFFMIF
jgi:hypothetical protein